MARVTDSPFAKPVARAVLVAAGLVLLAIIGRAGSAGAFGGAPPAIILPADAGIVPPLALASSAGPMESAPPPAPAPAEASTSPPAPRPARATPESPVYLNAAGADELRRLPGV